MLSSKRCKHGREPQWCCICRYDFFDKREGDDEFIRTAQSTYNKRLFKGFNLIHEEDV